MTDNNPFLISSASPIFGGLQTPDGSYLAASLQGTSYLASSFPGDSFLAASSFQDLRLRDVRFSFPKNKIKVLLLEKVHPNAISLFESEGFHVDSLPHSLSEDDLAESIRDIHILGVRSKTRITRKILDAARSLLAIGCFCIGTEQVDLQAAASRGVPVFNAPFANTRSVAELILGEILALARQIVPKTIQMHDGVWDKSAEGSVEIRGKSLGIVGYGHIGSQLSVMAESLGMRVLFYDIVPKLPLGNAKQLATLDELLSTADFVSLHVPGSPQTENMIGKPQFDRMKKGAFFLNASRGKVVQIADLAEALKSGHIAGAAIDVFPAEPVKNGRGFNTVLQSLPNVILTPHIAGSTQESQAMIGTEVASALIRLVNLGSTPTAVNFPQLDLPYGGPGKHRVLNVHRNRPGVLRDVNAVLASTGANVSAQMLGTTEEIGYLIVDVDKETCKETKKALQELGSSIKTRILY